MITLTQLDSSLSFPPISSALDDPNGLLAFGGDLSVPRLVKAYQSGIFPWFSPGEPILWWSPDPRGVINIPDFMPSKSLRKHLRKSSLTISINKQFEQVIHHCAHIPRADDGTWITEQMQLAYIELHHAGYAHSVEVWENGHIIGGLYGIYVNNLFCGESMFSLKSNASKVALLYLVNFLKDYGVEWIDCQMQNPHLQKLGCVTMPRHQFSDLLEQQRQRSSVEIDWTPKFL